MCEALRELMKDDLEEMCEEGVLRAIQIKGHACYGDGHPLYPCDWKMSRDCTGRKNVWPSWKR